jgi:hypothetical protein
MHDFRMRIAVDVDAAFAGLSTSIGGRLGLYTAMADAGAAAMRALAERAGLSDWKLGMETMANRVYAVKR